MAAVLSQEAFLAHIAEELSLPAIPAVDDVVWDAGIDSALLIELVFAIEDLGVELPDDLPWESITLGDLYREYAVRVAASTGR